MNIYVDAINFSSFAVFGNTRHPYSDRNILPLMAISSLFSSVTPWFVMHRDNFFSAPNFDTLFLLTESPTYKFTRRISLKHMKDCYLDKVISPCKNLKQLDMSECRELMCEESLPDAMRDLIHLEEVCIGGAIYLPPSALSSSLRWMPYLRVLDLTACIELTSEFFVEAFLTGHGKSKVRSPNPTVRLETLIVDFCDRLDERTLEILAEFFSDSLEHFSASLAIKCVTDKGLDHFVSLPRLKSFNCSQCFGVTDVGLAHLGETFICSETPLETLNLANLRLITHVGIEAIFSSSTNFSVITNDDFNSLPPRLTSTLKHLNLNLCIALDDSAIYYLRDLEALETLEIAETKVTDSGIELLTYSKSVTATLVKLNCSRCERLTTSCSKFLVLFRKMKILLLVDSGVEDVIVQSAHFMEMKSLEKLGINISAAVYRWWLSRDNDIKYELEGEHH